MAVVKATFTVTVELPDSDIAENPQLSDLNFSYDMFEDNLPEGWEVARATRDQIERLD